MILTNKCHEAECLAFATDACERYSCFHQMCAVHTYKVGSCYFCSACRDAEEDWAKEIKGNIEVAPIPMLLFCPRCHEQHIDAPQPEKGWINPPHRSHECQACGYTWRPADVPTVGVAALQTRGKRDGKYWGGGTS